MNRDIDFVILWVDGNDSKWQEEFIKYSKEEGDKRIIRYRDWDNLQYILRSFEEFTPWVRKIHFVTWGHLPSWLDTVHPKLNVVQHEDYIDSKILPVFNANPLEINIHNIDGLAEHFVFFNDDFFITKPLPRERFFQNDLPCDMLVSNALSSSSGVGHFVLNSLEILNRHFDKKTAIKKNIGKWFNFTYGNEIMRSLLLLPWPRFTGFVNPHQPQAFLKSTFEEVWSKEKELLQKTSASRFRHCEDVNQYLFRYWQLASGKFHPVSMKDTAYEEITMDNINSGHIERFITSGSYSLVCLNDTEEMDDEAKFLLSKESIKSYFEEILPQKSSFEK